MVVGDLVGEIAVCSDCHQKKKIGLEGSRGSGKDGKVYPPFLRCVDCMKLQLEKTKCEHVNTLNKELLDKLRNSKLLYVG